MNETVVAYGVQSADYKISGTIVSSDQDLPIKGLLVTIQDSAKGYPSPDSTKTDSLGRYLIEFSSPPWGSKWDLTIKDIDSTENGSFVAKDTIISIPLDELAGADKGHVEKKVDIKLDKI